MFGGGWDGSYQSSAVDAYDQTLTRTTPTSLSYGREYLAATTVGNYALFGGGAVSYVLSIVDAYDTSLTRTTPTGLSQSRYKLAATSVGNYALFGGGGSAQYTRLVVDAYDTNLTRTTPTALSLERRNLAATTVGNYALFGGGEKNGIASSVVDAYDTSLTRTNPTGLNEARGWLAATTVSPAVGSSSQSSYALFGGGAAGSSYSSVVDAYDTNLTRTTPTELSQARKELAAPTVAPIAGSSSQSGYAVFGGGYSGSDWVPTVDAYDASLTRTIQPKLSVGRSYLSGTSIGNYALFAGGYAADTQAVTTTADAYSLASYDIQVFPGTKYSFNGSTEQTSSTWQTLTMQGEVIGYIKVKDATVN